MKHPLARLTEVSDEFYEVSELRIEALSSQRLWLFDLEATGLDTTRERVTQIAGIPIDGGRIIDDAAFVQFVNPGPGVEISKEVQELTGIKPEMLEDAPSFGEAWAACLQAAHGSQIWIGQSVFEFDVPLLQAEFERHGLPQELPGILDSVVMATAILGPAALRWSTSALIQRFEVDTSGLRRHDALDDVKILGRILLPMIELIRNDAGDRLEIPADKPLRVRRHPPVRSEPKAS